MAYCDQGSNYALGWFTFILRSIGNPEKQIKTLMRIRISRRLRSMAVSIVSITLACIGSVRMYCSSENDVRNDLMA